MKEFSAVVYNNDGTHYIIKAMLNLNDVVMFQEYENDHRQTHILLCSGHDTIIDTPYDIFKENFKKASDE